MRKRDEAAVAVISKGLVVVVDVESVFAERSLVSGAAMVSKVVGGAGVVAFVVSEGEPGGRDEVATIVTSEVVSEGVEVDSVVLEEVLVVT